MFYNSSRGHIRLQNIGVISFFLLPQMTHFENGLKNHSLRLPENCNVLWVALCTFLGILAATTLIILFFQVWNFSNILEARIVIFLCLHLHLYLVFSIRHGCSSILSPFNIQINCFDNLLGRKIKLSDHDSFTIHSLRVVAWLRYVSIETKSTVTCLAKQPQILSLLHALAYFFVEPTRPHPVCHDPDDL